MVNGWDGVTGSSFPPRWTDIESEAKDYICAGFLLFRDSKIQATPYAILKAFLFCRAFSAVFDHKFPRNAHLDPFFLVLSTPRSLSSCTGRAPNCTHDSFVWVGSVLSDARFLSTMIRFMLVF